MAMKTAQHICNHQLYLLVLQRAPPPTYERTSECGEEGGQGRGTSEKQVRSIERQRVRKYREARALNSLRPIKKKNVGDNFYSRLSPFFYSAANKHTCPRGSCFIVVEFLSPPKRYKKGGFK